MKYIDISTILEDNKREMHENVHLCLPNDREEPLAEMHEVVAYIRSMVA
jgi:hypothetical protein